MNPLLPTLVALSLGGLVASRPARWRSFGRAWCVVGLAGVALLWPAWRLDDGIPSPSATLERVAPWRPPEGPSPHAGNGELVDVTFQVEPWLLFLRSELRAGRLPFWNPFQSSGAPFWSNGSSAPLFPFHLLFAALPLQAGFVLLPWLRIVLGGLGAIYLARRLGASEGSSLLAGIAYPLCGRLAGFLLFPMGNTLALVPWVWLAVERIAAQPEAEPATLEAAGTGERWRSRWRRPIHGSGALALATGLQLLGGHPETAVFTGVVTLLYLAVRGAARPLLAWVRFAVGWVGGLLLAAVQLVPLAFTLLATDRWQVWHAGAPPSWGERALLAVRWLLPDALGSAIDGTWFGPFLWMPTGFYVGALTLPLALVGAAQVRRSATDAVGGVDEGRPRAAGGWLALVDRRLAALLVVAAFALGATYALPGIRHLLLALPVIQKGLHHYFAFAAELALAVLAARGIDRWRARGTPAVLPAAALVAAAVGLAWWVLRPIWSAREVAATVGVSTAILAAALVLLLGVGGTSLRRRPWGIAVVCSLTALDLARVHGPINPGLSVGELYPRGGVVERLASSGERVTGIGYALRPNAAMVYRLFDVRGDDSLKLSRYERTVGGALGERHPTFFRPISRWDSPWLDRLGVRFVLDAPGARAPVSGWTVAYDGPDARLFERSTAQPLVRVRGACEHLATERRDPGRWELVLTVDGRCAVEVAEVFDPGWRASFDGRRLPVDAVDGVLLGVALDGEGAAHRGRLVLTYRPQGLELGLLLSLVGLLGLGLGDRIATGLAASSERVVERFQVSQRPVEASMPDAGSGS